MILSLFSISWESKVATTEARNLETMTINDLTRKLKTYELKKYQDRQIEKPCKDKNLVLKDTKKLETDDDVMELLTPRF